MSQDAAVKLQIPHKHRHHMSEMHPCVLVREKGLQVQAIHQRAQQLLLFFIDGATPIDQTEPEWDLFMAVQTLEDGSAVMVNALHNL